MKFSFIATFPDFMARLSYKSMSHDVFTPKKSYGERLQAAATSTAASASQRVKIAEKVSQTKVDLNCESTGEKGRSCIKQFVFCIFYMFHPGTQDLSQHQKKPRHSM